MPPAGGEMVPRTRPEVLPRTRRQTKVYREGHVRQVLATSQRRMPSATGEQKVADRRRHVDGELELVSHYGCLSPPISIRGG